MEPAWEKVQAGKFSLLQKSYDLPNGGKKMMPYYSLTKTECLYIATKFKDEMRAKLVLRWEELERERLGDRQQLALPSPQKILALRDSSENLDNLAKARQGDEAAKRNLVQFAYNLGHVDGLIAGCKARTSATRHGRRAYPHNDTKLEKSPFCVSNIRYQF